MLKTIGTKLLFIFICFWLQASSSGFAAGPGSLPETQNDKESYSIGYQVGLSMKTDGVEVNFERLVQGLQDAINEKAPLLSMKEMRTLIVDLKKRAREARMKETQEQAVENARESKEFLEKNKTKEGVKTTKSGLQYKVLREGNGVFPGPKDFVTANYRGTLIDGKEFDSTYAKGEPARVQVNRAIKGWTEALPMMKTGAKWELYVPPDLGYGKAGFGRKIPPNKVLVYEIELIAVDNGDETAQPPSLQTAVAQTARRVTLTGVIAKSRNGYIIRSKRDKGPGEIFTILNPYPNRLDELVKSGKVVSIQVRFVSGDNLNIEKIDGKEYP